MNEVYPLERVSEAYEWMMSGKAPLPAVVMTMGGLTGRTSAASAGDAR